MPEIHRLLQLLAPGEFGMTRFRIAALFLTAALSFPPVVAARDPARTVDSAGNVLKEFLDLQVKGIPASLLAEAHGVAIVPDVIKVGLVLGGQRGKGLVIVRERDGSWRAPTFITLTGGSIGWQIGAQSTDFVLVFKTQKSVEGLLKGKFTIGADAAAAAGPVGRRAGASTDGELKAEIYTYSRTRGLFAGVSLDGSVIDIDEEMNAAYYGVPADGAPVAPEAAIKLTQMIAQLAANPESIEGRPAPNAIVGEPTPARPRTEVIELGTEGPTLSPAQPMPAPLNALPGPAVAGQTLDAESVRQELARSGRQLHAMLDRGWQRYLELPDDVYRAGKRPSAKELQAAAARYETVAGDPRYQSLVERPEFQATRDWLRVYSEALATPEPSKLALPPPPGGQR
jgi:lipid-binding SYLF domain-containing protein